MSIKDYECVIGLEVHIELKTRLKLFCQCATTFGSPPNTQVCPVCLAMPGSLPALNREVVEFAIRAGIATHCTIAHRSSFDRKNYFYPDLPKAYQVTQNFFPICKDGYVEITSGDQTKKIRINRIHMEEDAGKLIHLPGEGTLIDCNRCGVPLIEVVSEPDLRSGEEAVAYLRKLRAMVRYTGISDGKMNEGSLRCDVNLSIRRKGQKELGTRVELKNINSFNFVARAVESEFKRQVALIEEGGSLVQETRRFDEKTGQTYSMRKKEAADYRYFHDPDLVPVEIEAQEIETVRAGIPRLAHERKAGYMEAYQLSDYEADRLTDDKELSDFFEEAVGATAYPKTLVNVILADVAPLYTEDSPGPSLSPLSLGRLADLIAEEKINSNTGRKVLKALMEEDFDPEAYIEEHDLAQINDRQLLAPAVERSISANQKAVDDYLKGKESALRSLMGGIMKETGGRANPILAESMIREALKGR